MKLLDADSVQQLHVQQSSMYIHGRRAFGPHHSAVEDLYGLQNKCQRIWTWGLNWELLPSRPQSHCWLHSNCYPVGLRAIAGFTPIAQEQNAHLLRITTTTIVSGLRKATLSMPLSVVDVSWMRFDPGGTNLDRWASA